ncbi:hypothetical protein KC992_01255 [Candidatus Saccharibacteria bacterium]|nr:hypothetical protein [Candidatus Saccharibacteria bacterium]MCA9328854.1 hypothetical protein [Candidatus Saccharibacteria bacterium]
MAYSYFRTGIELVKPFFSKGEGPSWIDTIRFARDSMHVAAGLALAGVGTVELLGDSPKAHATAIMLGGVAAVAEMGAWSNNHELTRLQLAEARN